MLLFYAFLTFDAMILGQEMFHRFGPVQDPALADLALLLPPRQTPISKGFQGSESLL